jgi:hypothetical protein
VSPTDPPLPPTPGEPSDDPNWAAEHPRGGATDEGEQQATGDESGVEDAGEATEQPEAEGPAAERPAAEGPAADEQPDEEPTGAISSDEEEPAAVVPPVEEAPVSGTEVMPAAPTAVTPTTDSSPSAEMRRRVSHRRYVARRIVVVLCALIVLGGIVGLILWALDGDDGGARGTGDSTQPAVVSDPPTTQARTTSTKPERTTLPGVVTNPDGSDPAGSEPERSGEATESTSAAGETTASSVPDTSEPEEPTYNLGLRAECRIDEMVQLGDTGPNVECLEQRLDQVTTGGVQFDVDDEFDEDTDEAVRQLQERNDLLVDGIVGPETGQLLSIWNPATD